MTLLEQLGITSQRFNTCLPYVPLNQLADITSILCLLVHHARHQEEEKFYELSIRFTHILEIVEELMREFQKAAYPASQHLQF